MPEKLCALCAQCRRPLSGAVVASGCNHLFYKLCIFEGAGCGRCGTTLRADNCWSLYNLSCEEEGESATDIMAATARIRASLEGLDDADMALFDPEFMAEGTNEVDEVALLCLMRETRLQKRITGEGERATADV